MARRKKSKFDFLDSTLIPAVLLSLGLHVSFVSVMHPFKTDTAKRLPTLEVMLEQPKKPEPVIAKPTPEPIKPPEPIKQKPKKTITTPETKTPPVPAKAVPSKQMQNNVAVPAASPQPIPEVIAATPQKEGDSTFTAPAPTSDTDKSKDPSPQDIDADLSKYGSLLAREFAKHKQYPRIAQIRGWQGTVRIKLEVDTNGSVVSSTISQSSGYESLDNQALEMVKKASPLPQPPETLRRKAFTITVPVLFRLE